jgi:hypothetical protein
LDDLFKLHDAPPGVSQETWAERRQEVEREIAGAPDLVAVCHNLPLDTATAALAKLYGDTHLLALVQGAHARWEEQAERCKVLSNQGPGSKAPAGTWSRLPAVRMKAAGDPTFLAAQQSIIRGIHQKHV